MTDMTFQTLGNPLRCVDDGELLFVVTDLCKALGLTNATKAMKGVFEEYRRKAVIGGREFNAVTEAGLYQLIMRSRKAGAVEFQKYVFEEVLPSLRENQMFRLLESNEETEYGKSVIRTIAGLN